MAPLMQMSRLDPFLFICCFFFAVRPLCAEAIEDNSFFIEEAYNQERGVVQHISNVLYYPTVPKNISVSFTQEWPAPSLKHQLGYTLPFTFFESGAKGIGDVLLNYRCQLLDKEDWAAVAPRFSLIVPSGNVDESLGSNTMGLQINLPVSKRWTDSLVTHFNIGATLLPHAQQALASGAKARKTLSSFNAGGSIIWLAHTHFNLLIETLANFGSEIDANLNINRFAQVILNPGLRASIDMKKLQIVPGFSVPLVWTKGDLEPGLFFYLSFEHPFF